MAKHRPLPPIDELRKRLAYRSDGVLIWKRPLSNSIKPGHLAGAMRHNGYFQMMFDNKLFMLHRIVWAIVKGEDPLELEIDHINRNRSDNRVANLRKATKTQNKWNKKTAKGYYFCKQRKKWRANIYINSRKVVLGQFDTEEQAREAYLRVKEKLHGEFMPSDMKHELGQIDGPTSQLTIFDD